MPRKALRTFWRWPLAASGLVGAALGWGYWHAQTHAGLNLQVHDHGLRTERQLYGTPHDVTLELLGPANEPLAKARSVEPIGYILAVHPNDAIGNCEHRGIRAPGGPAAPGDHEDCYAAHSAWAAQWAPKVRRANVVVGSCALRDLPVHIVTSNADWWWWWVPLPHVGGVPRRYFGFTLNIDSRTCTAVGQ